MAVCSYMRVLISSPANGSAMRMQTALAAAKATEQTRKKVALEKPIANQNTTNDASDKLGSQWPRSSASSDGPRVEVDRRTEDSKSVKITVISYSDGSSESVTLMKTDELTAQISSALAKPGSATSESSKQPLTLADKGLLVNKLA